MRCNILLFALCALFGLVLSASPPSFCKCTCFANSTIIKLSPEHSSTREAEPKLLLKPRIGGGSASCNLCNRAFCLSNNLPICKGAEEKDVFTTCFQRDSRKDQIIVLLFISTTVGLLGWAAVQKVIEKRAIMANPRAVQGEYSAVGAR